jgi:basic amino acid/polyamine antiporter, APA family
MSEKKKEEEALKRTMGIPSVFAICTGAAFSSGFFLLPGFAAEETGPSLPLIFLVAGILMLPAVFSISELSSAMPRAGGPYFFITRSFGPLVGIIGAIGIYLQWLLKGAFAFVGVGYYLSIVMEVPISLMAIGLISFFTLINLIGVKQSTMAEIVLVIILIIVLSLFSLAGIMEITPVDEAIKERFQPLFPFGLAGTLSAIAIVFVSFGGMGQVASVAEEIKQPSRTIPMGMLLSLAVVTLFYLVGNGIVIALVEPDVLYDNPTPIATATEQLSSLPIPVIVIVVAALAAFTSTGNAVILSAARYPLALSRDRLLWGKFGHLNKKGIPTYSVLLTGLILIAMVLLFDVEEIAKLASAFLLFAFIGLCFSLIIFRESKTGDYKPGFRSPWYPWVQIAGILVYTVLIIVSGFEVLLFVFGFILLGMLWYYIGVKEKTTFSAAIYPLFGKIAERGIQGISTGGIDLYILKGTHLSPVVERAIIIQGEIEKDIDDAVKDAAGSIAERIGGDMELLADLIREEFHQWLHTSRSNIAVAPVLLKGIEQPEMLIYRGKVKMKGRSVDGLMVILDDKKSTDRLLKLVSQLDTLLDKPEFLKYWDNATSAKEIKKCLSQNVRTLSVRVAESDGTSKLIGKNPEEIELPEGSRIAVILKGGKIRVPNSDIYIEKGDEIIIVAENGVVNSLSSKWD